LVNDACLLFQFNAHLYFSLGLTLVSQWKSQFDDSEETTDNEWKGENMPSPEHKLTSQVGYKYFTVLQSIKELNFITISCYAINYFHFEK
jgi:hypothetical protein